MALVLAIDLGTTNLKVGLIDESGALLRLEAAPVPVSTHGHGAAAHDPDQLKTLILDLSKKLLVTGGADEVAYVACSTYQFGLMLLDANKKPLTGMTLLADIRSQRTFDTFTAAFENVDIYARTGCPMMSLYALARLHYFAEEEPTTFRQAHYLTDSKSFLFEWLTGEFVTDISTAAASQLYNIADQSWDESLLAHVGLSPSQCPTIEDGTTYFGTLREAIATELDLPSSVRVLLGVYDGAALAIGLGGLQPGVGVINVGTSAMLRVPGSKPAFDRSDNKRIQPYRVTPSVFLNGGALNNAALPANWLLNNLFDVDIQDEAMLSVGTGPPLLCLPYLTSERDSKTGPFASGVFFGLRQYHGKTDLARAVLEGVAYSMRYLLEAIRENGLPVEELRMGGGGTRVVPWPQIFSNVLGLPIHIPSNPEMGLLGSAMLALVAGGHHPDVAALSRQISRTSHRIDPDPQAVAIHDERYAFFKKVRETLAPLYEAHAALSGPQAGTI